MTYNDLRKGRVSMTGHEYHIIATTDARIPYFGDFDLACIAVRAWLESTPRGCQWLCWVLMPDHFHGLLSLGAVSLGQVMKYCKAISAVHVNRRLKRKGKIWQCGYYDRALREEDDRVDVARYIVANPLKAGLVRNLRQYPFWDSVWL